VGANGAQRTKAGLAAGSKAAAHHPSRKSRSGGDGFARSLAFPLPMAYSLGFQAVHGRLLAIRRPS
jgi:hypothetical protein